MPPDPKPSPITAKRSFREGHVAVSVSLRAHGWQGPSIKVECGADLTVAQARDLAASLTAAADQADAKAAAKQAAKDRKSKWREREIAAGRLKVMSTREFLYGR